jgi:alkylated DNA repair protein alkB family protein 4
LLSIEKDGLLGRRYSEPIPGLFLFENFISEEEEKAIMAQLDGESVIKKDEFLPWGGKNSYGLHGGKRWGVHCDLRERKVTAAENPLPDFVQSILFPKLNVLPQMMGCIPNEANAIDYRRDKGHWLKPHVDNWDLSKEPIANLSIAGDCVMRFRNVAPTRNTAVSVKRVLLKRRTLQILTGAARYDFTHGISHEDLLSDRRVSITMRESPLTTTS